MYRCGYRRVAGRQRAGRGRTAFCSGEWGTRGGDVGGGLEVGGGEEVCQVCFSMGQILQEKESDLFLVMYIYNFNFPTFATMYLTFYCWDNINRVK